MPIIHKLPLVILLLGFVFSSHEAFSQQPPEVTAIAWSDNAQQIALGYDDGAIEIIDASSRDIVSTLTGHTHRVISLLWHPNNKLLASSSFDATVRTWDSQSGTQLHKFYESFAQDIIWNIDADILIATLSIDGVLKLWDIETGDVVLEFRTGTIPTLEWNSDFTTIAQGGANGLIAFTDPTLGQNGFLPAIYQPEEMPNTPVWAVSKLEWGPNDERIAVGFLNGLVRVWDYPSLDLVIDVEASGDSVFNRFTTPVIDMAFAENNMHLLSVTSGGMFRRWNIADGNLLAENQLQMSSTSSAFSPDGTQLAYMGQNYTLEIENINDLVPASALPPTR